ncbi:unnamed protein product [Chrysoparadoxa australica]
MPRSWTKDKPIQMLPPSMTDTSDRTLFQRACGAFDSLGYAQEEGLEKALFYKSPYLTCARCNAISFVDASALRSSLELRTLLNPDTLPREVMPPCAGCGQTGSLRVGACDFTALLASSKEELVSMLRLQWKAALLMQKNYRNYLCRRWGKALLCQAKATHLMLYRCAQAIQTMVRGRLGRRAYETEKCLAVIKAAHHVLIEWALAKFPNRKKAFWYKTAAEERQLYKDYRELVQLTGYRPPRCVVEANIAEICRRVLLREAELASRVQKRWRGIAVRRYVKVYVRELNRMREAQVAMTFRIQRLWEEYMSQSRQMMASRQVQERKGELREWYMSERKEELTARAIGLVDPRLSGGNKMAAFGASIYGNDRASKVITAQVDLVKRQMKDEEAEQARRKRRAEWVRMKQTEDPMFQAYFRQELIDREVYVVKQCTGGRARGGKAGVFELLQDHNRKGIKFPYPKFKEPYTVLLNERSQADADVIKRISHASPSAPAT